MAINNKHTGMITQLHCLLDLINRDISVSVPYGDNDRYDFIADIKGKLYKIQCKTSNKIDDGAYQFATVSNNWSTKKKYHYNGQIDYFMTYINDNSYLVSIDEVGDQNAFTLRFAPTKSGQIKKIHFANDYMLDNVLETL